MSFNSRDSDHFHTTGTICVVDQTVEECQCATCACCGLWSGMDSSTVERAGDDDLAADLNEYKFARGRLLEELDEQGARLVTIGPERDDHA